LADSNEESTLHLLAEARAGRGEALELLCRRYLPRIRTWARGRLPECARNLEDTDDLVQDAFLRVLRHMEHFDPQHSGAFLGLVRTTVRNSLVDRYRRMGRRGSTEPADVEIPDIRPSPLEKLLGEECARSYEAALDALDPLDRALLFSRFELRLEYQDVARDFGKPTADAARMAVKRAVMRLAETLGSTESDRI